MIVVVASFVLLPSFSGMVIVGVGDWCIIGGGGEWTSDGYVKVMGVGVVCGDDIHYGLWVVRLGG